MIATTQLPAATPLFRLWFVGSGLAMVLVGALNLLQRAYGHSAPGLRMVCRAANVALTLFAIVAGKISGASPAQYVVIVSLTSAAAILSFLPAAQSPPPARAP